MKTHKLSDFLFALQSRGRLSTTLDELRQNIDSSDKALLQNLHRLKSKNQIAQIRKEFYVIVPPQYSHQGTLPVLLFLDDMMRFLKREYYLGLYSAAALHGAGHQQPMESQVIIHKPALRVISNKKQKITFFTKSHWKSRWLIQKKTESGYIWVSSPELTAFDLVQNHKKTGGLNRLIPILEDLSETLSSSKLANIAAETTLPTIQRLGYILEQCGQEKLVLILAKILTKKSPKPVPLSLSHQNRKGQFNTKWSLILNAELDFG
jgi:predicted transcriptional regulator of viral defense system